MNSLTLTYWALCLKNKAPTHSPSLFGAGEGQGVGLEGYETERK